MQMATDLSCAPRSANTQKQFLGLDNPNRVLHQLSEPRTATALATATGMSNQEAQATLSNLRARVEAVKDDPARVTGKVRNFLAQYAERSCRRVWQDTIAAAEEFNEPGKFMTFIAFERFRALYSPAPNVTCWIIWVTRGCRGGGTCCTLCWIICSRVTASA
jgi:hypothetical protein